MKPKVYCKIPKAGLGNQFLVMMNAYLYANKNNMDITFYNFHFNIGPFLRGERSKRNYRNYYTFKTGVFHDLTCEWNIIRSSKNNRLVKNPPLSQSGTDKTVVFDKLPSWSDYFAGLNQYRPIVKKLLFSILNAETVENFQKIDSPEIGVHIRMGDFRKLKPDENFAEVGGVRTPEPYFVEIITKLRELYNSEMPVTVFTDGYKSDLVELFSLPNVTMASPNSDIGDLLHLSKSKIIVTSAGSTFSLWAGFVSDSPMILHPDHIHKRIRLEDHLFEGAIDDFILSKQETV